MKFALISNVLPPSETAHAAIIERLLRDLDPDQYVLLSSRNYEDDQFPEYSQRLSARYYHLKQTYRLTRDYRFGLESVRNRVNLMLDVVLRARQITRVLRDECCDAVVVCTGGNELFDFPAGYLASRWIGARFYAYLLDQYSHMVSYVMGNSFLRCFEPLVMKGAAGVIVPNEFMQNEVNRRFGVDPVIIRNACDLAAYDTLASEAARIETSATGDADVRIVYTGGVGPLHYDVFRNLLAAIGTLGRDDIKLHLYTNQSSALLQTEGICGPVVYHEHLPISAMPMIQSRADVLFLPLAFQSPYPDIVRTAAPGKIGEYLAARRPILVHAPADSFVAWYFRRYECGLVVDLYDPEALAQALSRLLSDPALGKQLIERAWERARDDFALPRARAQFASIIGF